MNEIQWDRIVNDIMEAKEASAMNMVCQNCNKLKRKIKKLQEQIDNFELIRHRRSKGPRM